MTQFSQVRHKIEKTFNNIRDSFKELANKKNQEFLLNQIKSTTKVPFVVYDSDWTTKAIDNNDITTINKGVFLPQSLSLELEQDISIPERFLSFIKPLVFIKPTPDSTLSSFTEYETENWSGNFFRVKGNGATIYEGESIGATHVLSLEQLEAREVPENRTKKIFQGTITYLDASDGDTEKSVTGRLAEVQITEQIADGCGGGEQFNIYFCSATNDGIFAATPSHKFLDVNSNSITMICQVTQQRWIDDGEGGCEFEQTVLEDQEVTQSFVDSETNNIQLTISNTVITTADEITEQEYEHIGYRGYYSTETEGPITIVNAGQFVLQNLPNDTEPYSTITLERNHDDFPITTTEVTDFFTISSVANIATGNTIDQELSWWRISSGDINTFPNYRLKYRAGITLLGPARLSVDLDNIDTQNYTYTLSGGSYTLTSSETGSKSKPTYTTVKGDIQYRLLFVITNPFAYKELRNYNYDQTNFKPN